MKSNNIVLSRWFSVPIYDREVLIVVAHDAVAAAKRYKKTFELGDVGSDWAALCVNGNARHGIFFHTALLLNSYIAHEISHLVTYIKHEIGDHPCCSERSDEPDAYLSGYLTARIYGLFKKHKLKIHND